jgi:hypothetical protein
MIRNSCVASQLQLAGRCVSLTAISVSGSSSPFRSAVAELMPERWTAGDTQQAGRVTMSVA